MHSCRVRVMELWSTLCYMFFILRIADNLVSPPTMHLSALSIPHHSIPSTRLAPNHLENFETNSHLCLFSLLKFHIFFHIKTLRITQRTWHLCMTYTCECTDVCNSVYAISVKGEIIPFDQFSICMVLYYQISNKVYFESLLFKCKPNHINALWRTILH